MKKILSGLILFVLCFGFTSCSQENSQTTEEETQEEPLVYAQIDGRVVYYFNEYRGDVADDGALVCLLKVIDEPVSEEVSDDIYKAMDFPSIYYEGEEEKYESMGLYMTKVDSTGSYYFNNIPNGKYTLYIHSNHVDYYSEMDGCYTYETELSDGTEVTYEIPFTEDQIENYGFITYDNLRTSWIPTSKFCSSQIIISGTSYKCGETNFGMCVYGIGVIPAWS